MGKRDRGRLRGNSSPEPFSRLPSGVSRTPCRRRSCEATTAAGQAAEALLGIIQAAERSGQRRVASPSSPLGKFL